MEVRFFQKAFQLLNDLPYISGERRFAGRMRALNRLRRNWLEEFELSCIAVRAIGGTRIKPRENGS